MTILEAAAVLGVSDRAIRKQATQGRFPGAQRIGWAWLVPARSVMQRLVSNLEARRA